MRIALVLVLAACHPAPVAQPPAPPPAPTGCQTAAACNADADDALGKNDIPRALDSLNRACAFGDVHSCAREGVYLTTNPQQGDDRKRSIMLLQEACDGNDALGCEKLAATPDDAKAAQLYDKACGLGDSNACGALAPILQHGTGTAVDHARAVQLAQQACDAGAAIGCTASGESFAEGWNGVTNPAHATDLFTKSCAMNDGRGCADLANLTTDPTDAARLRAKACANGYQTRARRPSGAWPSASPRRASRPAARRRPRRP